MTNNDYLTNGSFKHEHDAWSDLFDDTINSHAMDVGMDPDHKYWDQWYDAEWLIAFQAYMQTILPGVSLTITAEAPPEGTHWGFIPWTIKTEGE